MSHHFSEQDKSEFKELVVILLAVTLLSPSFFSAVPAFAGVSFGTVTVLNSTDADSANPQIAANSSSGVYVVWHDNAKLNYSSSANNGSSFAISDVNIGVTTTADKVDPEVAANSTDGVYVVWQNDDEIHFSASSNGGTSFDIKSASKIGSATSGVAAVPALAVQGDNVYVAWREAFTGDYRFVASSDGGTTFHSNVTLGSAGSATNPGVQIATNSSKGVYVVWVDGLDIKFSASDDSGDNFTPASNVDIGDRAFTEAGVFHADPQIAANGTNVFVVWEDFQSGGDRQINFTRSTDGGASFETEIEISGGNAVAFGAPSGTPQIALGEKGNVFLVWQDGGVNTNDGEIKFRRSQNSGVSFDTEKSLSSGSSISSELPQIAFANDVIYVTWVEENTQGIDHDIYLKTSINNGTTFSSFQNLGGSDSNDFSEVPQLAAVKDKVFVVWSENENGATSGSIKYITGTGIPTDITLNQTQYLLSDEALITVENQASNTNAGSKQNISVQVTSTGSTGAGIPALSLEETEVDSGIFTGVITFTSGSGSSSSGSILNVTTGATISAAFNGVTGSSTIHSRTIAFDSSSYTIDKIAFLTVTDLNSNFTTSVETVDVTITSLIAGKSATVRLTETSGKSGVFGDSTDNSVIFMNNHTTYQLDTSFTISQVNITNANPGGIDTTSVNATSDTDPSGATITLTETGDNTGIFNNGEFTFTSGPTVPGVSVQATANDYVIINYTNADGSGTLLDRGLITPNSNQSRAAIEIETSTGASDAVKATFGGASTPFISVSIQGGESGGGGGGLVRPTIVLNVIAGISSFGGAGGGTDGSAPIVSLGNLITNKNFDAPDEIVKIVENYDSAIPLEPISTSKFPDFDLPLTINESGYPLGGYSNTIETFSTDIGEPVTITSLYYEQTALQHVSMYLNLRGIITGDLSKSDTQILYNKDKPLVVIDPNGFFESVSVNVIEDEDLTYKKFAQFKIIFAKPMETSDIVLRSWDNKLRSMDTIIYDAIQVIDLENTDILDDTLESESVEELTVLDTDVQKVPEWIKNNIEWWSQGEVDETTFKNTIQFLVQEKIIDVPTGPNVSVSKDDELAQEELQLDPEPLPIPEWIKNNAEWWSQGVITEDDFLKSIKYLVENGIIQI